MTITENIIKSKLVVLIFLFRYATSTCCLVVNCVCVCVCVCVCGVLLYMQAFVVLLCKMVAFKKSFFLFAVLYLNFLLFVLFEEEKNELAAASPPQTTTHHHHSPFCRTPLHNVCRERCHHLQAALRSVPHCRCCKSFVFFEHVVSTNQHPFLLLSSLSFFSLLLLIPSASLRASPTRLAPTCTA